MEEIFISLLSLFALVSFFFGFRHHLHMFQLNSYHKDVQLKWIRTHFRKNIAPSVLALISALLLYVAGFFGILLSFVFLLASFLLEFSTFLARKKAKKPLVYTARVKRMIVTSYIVFVVPAILIFFWSPKTSFLYEALILTFLPFYMILVNFINTPIEKHIRNGFIKEAKDLLSQNDQMKIVGITGSYGKTSMKFFLGTLLSSDYNVLVTPENYNTPMGVVKTVREHLSPLHEVFICEMGAKRKGEIKELCDLVHPEIGVITSIGPQHLDTFGTQETVRKTKFELAYSLEKGHPVFLNADSPEVLKENYKGNAIYYSLEGKGDYNGTEIHTGEGGTTFTLVHFDERIPFETELIGRHNVLNIVGAIAVARELGVSYETLKKQVKKIHSVPHRLQLLDRGKLLMIDDAYNSNPEGAKAALETLSAFDGFKILVTPGMVELGSKQYECNELFGEQAAKKADYVVLIGKKQTEPIYNGLIKAGYPENQVYIANNLNEGISHVYSMDTKGIKPIILLENDLPDNF